MARPLRIEYPHALYHVTSRGNARKKIFRDDHDREKILDVLASVVKRYHWICHAYCLMDNHYHLLIETPEANLSKGMRQFNGVYTQAYNIRHRRPGHIFQGRFKGILVEKESYLLELCRYVVLNPVRAKRVNKPEAWKWSSYRATVGLNTVPSYLTIDWVVSQFSSQKTIAQQRYKAFVMEGLQVKSPWGDLQGQIILGEEGFVKRFSGILAEKEGIKEIPRLQRYANRADLSDIFKEEAVMDKTRRNRQITTAHLKFGYTLKEIADYLSLHYTTVSKALKTEEAKN